MFYETSALLGEETLPQKLPWLPPDPYLQLLFSVEWQTRLHIHYYKGGNHCRRRFKGGNHHPRLKGHLPPT